MTAMKAVCIHCREIFQGSVKEVNVELLKHRSYGGYSHSLFLCRDYTGSYFMDICGSGGM